MSLTGLLDLKDSPVKRFMRETFPNTREPLKACRDALRVPFVAPPSSKAYGQIGTAIDYRIRYHFAITPWHEFVAARGAMFATLSKGGGLTMACFAEFVTALERTINEIAPDRRSPTEVEERTLARFCLVLTALEAIFRAGPATPPPRYYGETWPTSATDLIDLIPDDRVNDVAVLGAAFAKQYPSWHGEQRAILNPTFAGSLDIGGADADLIVDGCLWDIKTTTRDGGQGRDLYQLLGYTLLDYGDEYAIERVGLLFPRQNAKVDWPVSDLIEEMAGRDDLDLAKLRGEFRAICESLKADADLGPALIGKVRAEYKAWVERVEANSNPRQQRRRSKCDGCGRRRVLNYWTNGSGAEASLCRECLMGQQMGTAPGETVNCRCGTVIAVLANHQSYCLDAIRHDWPRRSVASVAEARDYLTQQPEPTAQLSLVLYYMDYAGAFERSDGRMFTNTVDGWLCDACGESVPERYEQISQFFALLEAHACGAAR